MYTIRLATKNDFKDIQKLNTEIFVDNVKWDSDTIENYSTSEQGAKYFKDALESKSGCFFVAVDGGELIGYANGCDMNAYWRRSKYFELENIGVIPERKKEGIGKALLAKVTKWAKDNGFDKIYINCYSKNIEALDFYKQQGYEEIDICLEKKI